MESELIDVLIVLGCLGIFWAGGIILLIKYSNGIHFVKKLLKKEDPTLPTHALPKKRTTIKIARPTRLQGAAVQKKSTLARLRSAPVADVVHSTVASPVPALGATAHDFHQSTSSNVIAPEPSTYRSTAAVFIVPHSGKQRAFNATDAHSVLSAQQSCDTQSSYLPQSGMFPVRRLSL